MAAGAVEVGKDQAQRRVGDDGMARSPKCVECPLEQLFYSIDQAV